MAYYSQFFVPVFFLLQNITGIYQKPTICYFWKFKYLQNGTLICNIRELVNENHFNPANYGFVHVAFHYTFFAYLFCLLFFTFLITLYTQYIPQFSGPTASLLNSLSGRPICPQGWRPRQLYLTFVNLKWGVVNE